MQLADYQPRPALVTSSTLIQKPRFPVIDAHNHLGLFGDNAIELPLEQLSGRLDEAGVIHYVDLDGGWGEDILQQHLDRLQPAGERFSVFGGVDWAKWAEMGEAFPEYAARRLEIQKGWGHAG